MNIFLLFLTTLFLIGYYVIYSPSQNLEHTETENIIKMADLRSLADCVVAAQNIKISDGGVISDTTYTDSCVETYKVVSQFICTGDNFNILGCDEQAAKYNYIITKSKSIPQIDWPKMLKVIETSYQDKGSLGIYNDSFLLTADMVGIHPIAANLSQTAKLEDGQLVYIMQYQIPKDYIFAPDNDPANCPTGTVAKPYYGQYLCVEYNSPLVCDTGWHLGPDSGECEPDKPDECELICATQSCYGDGKCNCDNGEPYCIYECDIISCPDDEVCCDRDISCPFGTTPLITEGQDGYDCVETIGTGGGCTDGGVGEAPDDETLIGGNPGGRSGSAGRTMQIPTVRSSKSLICPACMKKQRECNTVTEEWDYFCVPDASKASDKDNCWDETEKNDCAQDQDRVYFGFQPKTRTDGIKTNNGDDIVLERVLDYFPAANRDLKFHCADCETPDYGESVPSLVVKCD